MWGCFDLEKRIILHILHGCGGDKLPCSLQETMWGLYKYLSTYFYTLCKCVGYIFNLCIFFCHIVSLNISSNFKYVCLRRLMDIERYQSLKIRSYSTSLQLSRKHNALKKVIVCFCSINLLYRTNRMTSHNYAEITIRCLLYSHT